MNKTLTLAATIDKKPNLIHQLFLNNIFMRVLSSRGKGRAFPVVFLMFLGCWHSHSFAQVCTDTDPTNRFQIGSHSSAPQFRTPEEAGIQRCPLHNSTYGRYVKYDPPPNAVEWGFLYCNKDGGEYGIGIIYRECCPVNQTLIDGVCTSILDNGDKTHGSCGTTGNPCNPASGNKFQSEEDLARGRLGFTRYYNSTNLVDLGMGKGWRHTYLKRLALNGTSLSVISESGRGEPWTENGGVWQGDADTKVALVESASGFQLTRPNGDVENYDTFGRLVSTLGAKGEQTSYQYGIGGYLTQVTDHDGNSLSFEYVGGMLSGVSDGDGATYRYEYDANRNLTAVIFPDETPGNDADNPRKIYHYEDTNFPNHLTGITDENGDRFGTYSYAVDGKVIYSEHSVTSNLIGQERIDLTYQAGGTLVTDAAGTDVLWTFQDVLGASKITAKTNQTDNKGITQVWDSNGNLTSRTDAENRVTTYGYNATNQKTSMTEAYGTPQARTTTYEYVSADIDLVTKVTTPSVYGTNVKEVVTSYDTNLNVTAVTTNGFDLQGNPVTRATTFQHDTYGKVTQIDGPRTDVSDITTLEYYNCTTGAECGQLKKVTNALGHETTYDLYDAAARLKQMTDANGVVTTYDYHPRGWVLSVTQTPPSGTARLTTYEYDAVGQLKKVTHPDGSEQNYDYDAAHDLREITDNVGNKIEYTYDAKGNRTHELVYDPNGTLVRSTITGYDMRNFVESINAGGSVTQMVNNAVGNLTAQTDPNQNPSTTHAYDPLDRLTDTVDALTNTTAYDYNVADQLIQVTAPNGAVTSYEYDDLGNQTKEVSADRGTLTYSHDAAGNVISQTDARGVTRAYGYDALNRLVSIDYAGTDEDVSYVYDAAQTPGISCGHGVGRLCEVSDEAGHKQFTYDAFGNVTQVDHAVASNTYTWLYSYDAGNRVTSMTYPSSRVVSYARDAIGRITGMDTTVNGVSTTVIANRSYRGDGLRAEQQFGNGVWDTRTHDLQGRLTQHINAGSLPKDYGYDDNGNILTIDDDTGSRTYTYDVLDRLDSALLSSDTLGYAYDANGNRTSLTENSVAAPLGYQQNTNRLTQNNGTAVSLDAAGNTLSDQNGSRVFEYKLSGRMDRVLVSGSEVARYDYDANGLRIIKTTPSETTLYQYDLGGQMLAEAEPNGQLFREYLYADGELVAVVANDRGAPVVVAPADIIAEATAVMTSVSLGSATATDENGLSLSATPSDSGPFGIGTTTVVWTAVDSHGRSNAASQSVTIVDTTPPLLTAPADIILNTASAPLTVDIGVASVSDVFNYTLSHDAPAEFYLGTTTVVWTVIDENGNVATANQQVTINSTNPDCLAPSLLAQLGAPSQSSEYNSATYPAGLAINGILTDFTHTSGSASDAWWRLDFSELYLFKNIILHNRDNYEDRLRDIYVSVEDSQGNEVYKSALLNPENSLNGPASISIEIPPFINGYAVKVERVPDPDLSGGNTVSILSLGEVIVEGCLVEQVLPVLENPGTQGALVGESFSLQMIASDLNGDALSFSATGLPSGLSIDSTTGLISGTTTTPGVHDVTVTVSDGYASNSVSFIFTTDQVSAQCSSQTNLALTGTASQNTTLTGYEAYKGNNGVLSDFTHTSGNGPNWWQVTLSQESRIEQIVLHNRDSCCADRLRDLLVSVENSLGEKVYESVLINPENALSSPASISIDLPPAILGSTVVVTRVPDPDESGGSSVAVLSLGEVILNGCVVQGGQ